MLQPGSPPRFRIDTTPRSCYYAGVNLIMCDWLDE